MTGELSPASVYVSLLPVVEACVVVAVPGPAGALVKSGLPPTSLLSEKGREGSNKGILRIFISRRNLLHMKPITCHMDFVSE